MYRNVVTEMSRDRNGQTESARLKRFRPKRLRPKRLELVQTESARPKSRVPEWNNWQKSQGNSHQQTRNQLGTPGGRIFWGRPKFYIDSMYENENNGYAYNACPKQFFEGESFSRGRSPPLSYGPGHQMIRYV